MRTRILLLLALWCVPGVACARVWTFGAAAGSSIPNLRDRGGNEISGGWSTRVAPYGGVRAETKLSERVFVRAELSYVAQGGKRDGLQAVPDASAFGAPPGTTLYARFRNVAKLDYLELPLLAGLAFDHDRLFVAGGPYAGWLIAAHNETSGHSPIYADAAGTQEVAPEQDFGATTNDRADLRVWNVGLQLGIGGGLPIAAGSVTWDLRGELGFINLQKDPANGRNGTGCVVLALGYGWPTHAAR
ncbi:MAG TPA: outer membrane beta-barrel protein [Candidatus Eisenbacteria bacterium]|nr:outer membrane beta-barrel protein [Candidatus Eisenbacteria bacterium]